MTLNAVALLTGLLLTIHPTHEHQPVSELTVWDDGLSEMCYYDAVDHIYHFIWGAFCDWGLECAKEDLTGEDQAAKDRVLSVLIYALDAGLRLAHPVMPFITEEIWQKLPAHPDLDRPESIVIAKFPAFPDASTDAEWRNWHKVQEIISKIRSVRQQSEISPKEALTVSVLTGDAALQEVVEIGKPWIKRLAVVADVHVGADLARPAQALTQTGEAYEIFIPVEGLLDLGKELKRLETEAQRLSKVLKGIESKLGNANFVERAPQEVLQQTRAQRDNLAQQLATVTKNLEGLR